MFLGCPIALPGLMYPCNITLNIRQNCLKKSNLRGLAKNKYDF